MSDLLYVATQDGVSIQKSDGDGWTCQARKLPGLDVTCISSIGDSIVAGTPNGIYRSDNGGQSWVESSEGLSLPHLRWISHRPTNAETVLAGTEPAGIFLSRDGGRSWLERAEVGEFRDRGEWYLPYSPEAGCIRDFGFHGNRVYAAVEVGGLLVSEDAGMSWRLVNGCTGTPETPEMPGQIHPDVHTIHVHPSSPNMLLACCGGGLYRSENGGDRWEQLYSCYCRAAWWNPDDPNHIIFGPADGVSENGRIELTHDGGSTWTPASRDLSTPWPRRMLERVLVRSDNLFGILSDGTMLQSKRDSLEWHIIMGDEPPINAAS